LFGQANKWACPGHDEFEVNSRPQREILEIIDPKSKALSSKISCPK
jgi:hypothetical protein